ncbi:hypothetical protein Tco_1020070 [Tanacetum coccineum]|uniref:Uncharacterized protein n=1 Tax=Tanacetum coccineum TaxID=301880 RepID=A0ABQ5FZ91_9ASTR
MSILCFILKSLAINLPDRLDILKFEHEHVGFQLKALGSSNTYVLDFTMLACSITGTSKADKHVDTSLIHIESRKSPTAVLFDDDTGRISIRHCEY